MMRTPTVLCDIVQAYGPTSGGIRTYIDAKRQYFSRQGDRFRHVLVVPGAEDAVERAGSLTTYSIRAPRVPGTGGYRFTPRMDRVLSVLSMETPDIIEVGSPYLMPWVAMAHRRRSGCLVIGHYHTDFPDAYVASGVERLLGRSFVGRLARDAAVGVASSYARSVYSKCDVVITGSRALRDKLGAMGIRRVCLNPLGVDLELFHPKRRDHELRRRLGASDLSRILIYAGRLDCEKRPDWVLDAFLQTPDYYYAHLVIVGEGPLRQQLAREASSRANVHVLPYLEDKAELARYLASSDVYVTAGAHETFGLSVLEAQAAGLPVVGVRAGALVDRVGGDEGLLAEPNSRDHLASCLQRALRSDLQAMGSRARARVEREFGWGRCFERWIDVCESVRSLGASVEGHPVKRRVAAELAAQFSDS